MLSIMSKILIAATLPALAVLAGGFIYGSGAITAAGAGLLLAIVNLAMFKWIYGRLVNPSATLGTRALAVMVAILKFVAICAIVCLLVGPAGFNGAIFAAGYGTGLVVPALAFLACTKGTEQCHTE